MRLPPVFRAPPRSGGYLSTRRWHMILSGVVAFLFDDRYRDDGRPESRAVQENIMAMGTQIAADKIKLKRAYAPPEPSDGTCILIDRLWPWFGHRPERWPESAAVLPQTRERHDAAIGEARQIAGERGNHRRRQQNDHERVAEPAQEFKRQRQTPPLLQGGGAIAEPTGGGLGGADAVSAGSELPLEIGERDLPEFPLAPAIRCHWQSLWSV